MFQKESCIRGYHIYRKLWDAVVGEELKYQRECGNATDMYAVAVVKDSTIVGHLPRKISRIYTLFIRRGGVINCRVTGRREYSTDLPQGGVEIPYLLLFEGEAQAGVTLHLCQRLRPRLACILPVTLHISTLRRERNRDMTWTWQIFSH